MAWLRPVDTEHLAIYPLGGCVCVCVPSYPDSLSHSPPISGAEAADVAEGWTPEGEPLCWLLEKNGSVNLSVNVFSHPARRESGLKRIQLDSVLNSYISMVHRGFVETPSYDLN